MQQKNARLAVLLAISLCCQAIAQQPAASPPQKQRPPVQTSGTKDDEEVVRITTNVVQLDFVVTDKRGNQVTNLKPEDIEIFEDGRSQPITNFSYISTGPTTPATTTTPATAGRTPGDRSTPPLPSSPARRENVRRTFAIIVDDLGMSFETLVPARTALRKFVEQQIQPGDLVAIIRTGGEVGALQQFTTEKRQLLAAVERVRWNPCSRRGISNTARLHQDSPSPGSLMSGTRGGNTVPGNDLPACARFTLAGC